MTFHQRITFFRFIGFVNISLQFFGQPVRGGPPVLFLLVLELLRQFRVQYTAAVTVPGGSGVSHLHFLTFTAKMNILEISKSSSAKTEFSFFRYFFRRFSVFSFFSIPTSVSVFKISRYRFRFSVTDSALLYSCKRLITGSLVY